MYLNDIITLDELKAKSQKLNDQITQLDEKLNSLQKVNVTDEKLERMLEGLFQDMDHILSE